MRHGHVVRMLGVGAAALGDLVAMRESMYVVQELMAGGDLKELVAANMADPFNPAYSKAQALEWCMQVGQCFWWWWRVCVCVRVRVCVGGCGYLCGEVL